MSAVNAVAVVLPAWNEAATVGRCVEDLSIAAAVIAPVPVALTLVADRCTDHTVEIARRGWDGELTVLDVIAGSAGRARHFGGAAVLGAAASRLSTTWVATTDADSFVPRHWLAAQLRYAERGFAGVAGTIDLESWDALPPVARAEYRAMLAAARRAGNEHSDVFGANLGISASALDAVGGFPDVPCGEDHAVWRALKNAERHVVSPADLVVTTSGRRSGRAVGGLADLLARLSATEELAQSTSA